MLLDPPGGEFHIKAARLADSPWLAIKIATGFPLNRERNIPVGDGIFCVFRADTGQLAALLLDGGWLTEMRTAAAGALTVDLLAREDADSVGILGTGTQARFQLEAVSRLRRLTRVAVWGRNHERARRFARDATTKLSLQVDAMNDPQDVVRTVDILITATAAQVPIVEAGWLHPGLHITAVGSDNPTKQELAADVLRVADVVVIDDVRHLRVMGEGFRAINEGAIRPKDVTTLADVLQGQHPGRRDTSQVTIADLCGVGVQDAAIAELALGADELRETATSLL